MNRPDLLVPLGTRPEIVKLAPVLHALSRRGRSVRIVATGQHYDPALTTIFQDALGVQPAVTWQLPDGDAARVGRLLELALDEVGATRPGAVLLLGDTWTVPVFCLAARRHRVPVVHLEAGLRSFNETSMEEVNRKVAAGCASLHLAPTELAARFLRDEGVPAERVRVVGNPVIDVLAASPVHRVPLPSRRGVVVTAHRATNVDDPARLAELERMLVALAARYAPVTFPVHPRTAAALARSGADVRLLRVPGLVLRPPVPYDEMLALVAGALVVVTDSGGLQEEASWFGVPVVVLRTSTPRWEGVAVGSSVLTGLDAERAVEAVTLLAGPAELRRVAALPCPYGDGLTGERVADLLADPATTALLSLDEPDWVGKGVP